MKLTDQVLRIAMPLGAALALAACGAEPEEKSYEVDATDVAGGELQVTETDPGAVPVEVPETEMTNVPPDAAAEDDGELGDAPPIAE